MNFFGISSSLRVGDNAPEFPLDLQWFNSPPLTIQWLRGKIVLVDFFTYSCINCQRTFPYVKNWWDKYQDSGLIIIGVEAPEFEFEKDPKNLEKALKQYQIDWPVVLDKDHKVWDSYNNRAWPSKYLIDQTGKIIYTHVGEGNYLETEREIQEALKKAGFPISMELTGELVSETAKLGQTPELYLGNLRGIVGNSEGYHPGEDFMYNSAPYEGNWEIDIPYLNGLWESEPEYIEHRRDTEELEDYIHLSYRAKKVYLVMESASGEPLKVYISLDEVGLDKDNAGSDIKFDDSGQAFVEVKLATLYNLINTPSFGDHILKVYTKDKGLRAFAFTFGS